MAGVTDPVIWTERVTRRIKGIHAVRNVSISVKQGDVYGLIGGQGAGKSTLAHLLLGLIHPDAGSIRLFGSESLRRSRARIGYLPEMPRYHGNFTGRDYLRFHAELSGLKRREARLVADRVADTVGLGQSARKLVGGYSKAARQRLGLAVALLAGGAEPPDLLILDEPATGQGDDIAGLFRDVVLDCRERGSTIFICSRELTALERACTKVGILRAGRLLVQTPVDESPRTHLIGVAREGASAILPHLTGYLSGLHPSVIVTGDASEGEHLRVVLPAGPGIEHAVAMKAAALRAMIDARWDVVSVYTENRDLDSLFLQAAPNAESKTKSEAKETPVAVSPTHEVPTAASAARSSDTGPLEAEAIGSDSDQPGTAVTSSAETGPLPPLESDPGGRHEYVSINGGAPAPLLDGVAVEGNGVGAGSSGPSTAPLPALDAGTSTNGHEAAQRPLPVRAISSARRVSEEVAEGSIAGGDPGE